MTRTNETVPGIPGLYVRRGKRKDSYSARLGGTYHALGHDLDAAKRKLRVLLELPPEDDSIKAMCEDFIREQQALIDSRDPVALAQGTLDDYKASLERTIIPIFGSMKPRDFKPAHGAQFLDRRRKGDPANGIKPAGPRANRELAALSGAFNHGMRIGMADYNPCRGVRRNKERPRQRKVEVAELNAFLAHAREKGGSAYLVALIGCCVALSGRRRAEILALPKSAATPDGLKVKDSKTKAGEAERFYVVGWSPLLRQLFAEAAAIPRRVASVYLFPTLDGQAYTDRGFKTLWNRIMHSFAPSGAKSSTWFRAHDLRALYVSEMLEQGRNPNTHKNEQTMRTVYDRRRSIKVTPLA